MNIFDYFVLFRFTLKVYEWDLSFISLDLFAIRSNIYILTPIEAIQLTPFLQTIIVKLPSATFGSDPFLLLYTLVLETRKCTLSQENRKFCLYTRYNRHQLFSETALQLVIIAFIGCLFENYAVTPCSLHKILILTY